MKKILELINKEPVLFYAAISALISTLIKFGLTLTQEQETSLLGLISAVLIFFTRASVTPNKDVEKQVETALATTPPDITINVKEKP